MAKKRITGRMKPIIKRNKRLVKRLAPLEEPSKGRRVTKAGPRRVKKYPHLTKRKKR